MRFIEWITEYGSNYILLTEICTYLDTGEAAFNWSFPRDRQQITSKMSLSLSASLSSCHIDN